MYRPADVTYCIVLLLKWMSSVLQEIKLSGTQELSSYLGVALEDVAVVDTASNLPNLEGQVTLEEAVDVVDYLRQCVQGMSLLDLPQ